MNEQNNVRDLFMARFAVIADCAFTPDEAPVSETGFTHIQNGGTFLWTVISKICPRIIRSKKVLENQ